MLDMFLLPSLFAVIALAKLSTALPLKRASEADITVLRASLSDFLAFNDLLNKHLVAPD